MTTPRCATSDLDIAGGGTRRVARTIGPVGKSTLLRNVSLALVRQSEGRVLFDDDIVDPLPPSARGVGIVFQNYRALLRHILTYRENVAYGLQAHKWPRDKIAPRVAEMLALAHMSRNSPNNGARPAGTQSFPAEQTAAGVCVDLGARAQVVWAKHPIPPVIASCVATKPFRARSTRI